MKHVRFKTRSNIVAGDLYLPEDFKESRKYPALVLATPGSSVKEQIGANYASRLVEHGYIALTFDPSYQGQSEGEPRDLEDPSVRAEDIRCALDYLMTLSYVDEERVGLLGICAGGGYAIAAAVTDHRFKAVATVVGGNIGEAFRRFMPGEVALKTLEAVGKERTAEARGIRTKRDPWIPDSLQEAHEQGVTDPELLEAVNFYRDSQYKHPNSTNRLLFRSFGYLLGFDAFHLVPELLIQPLQVIVGSKRGNTGQYEAGETLYGLSQARMKDFYVIEGASHYDMYFRSEYLEPAINRLASFYAKHLV